MADHAANIPWREINSYILSLTNAASPNEFATEALKGIRKFIPFDRAIVLFYDVNSEVRDCCMMGYDKRLAKILLDYYLSRLNGLAADIVGNLLNDMDRPECFSRANMAITDWTQAYQIGFVNDYVRLYGLSYSMNFKLFDCRGSNSMGFNLDRISNQRFTAAEIQMAQFIIPHLNSMNKKFYFRPQRGGAISGRMQAAMELGGLTRREQEIAAELCSGTSPANISKRLHITPATTHKHIAHIYKKLKVSNLQELLVFLLGAKWPDNDPPGGRSKK